MKLISMTDFVENLRDEMTLKAPLNFKQTKKYFDKVFYYSDFLKQPLKLEMFVPCDEYENVLECPIDIYYKPDFGCQKYPQECYEEDLMKYEQAKEKVLFEDCELYNDVYVVDKNNFQIVLNSEHIVTITKDNIIEDLSFSDYYYLTPNAIKQIEK